MNVTEPSQFVTSIVGEHIAGYGRYDVKAIQISEQICHYLPQGFTNFFPNIKSIYLRNSQLKSLCSFDLLEYRNVLTVYFHSNHLTTLPSHLFKNNVHLKLMYFNNNRLKFIHENIFDDLPALERAYFNNTICAGATLEGTVRNDVIYVVEKKILKECQVKGIHEVCDDRLKELSMRLCDEEFPHVEERLRKKYNVFNDSEH
jgi:Leucine rich repeat